VSEPHREAEITLAQSMLPSDANAFGNVHGGTLMKLADMAGGIVAIRHARAPVVTAVMDSMTFEQPVYVGNLVTLRACVTWTGRTSLETQVILEAEDVVSGEVRRISIAYLVYVAIDAAGAPTTVRPFEPTTEAERQQWHAAEERRAVRLQRRQRAVA
jgi:acyl-CoA hydrolase